MNERWHEPMLASKTQEEPTDDDGRIYEPKLDGNRVIVVKTEERTRLYSRTGNQLLGQDMIPLVTQAAELLGGHTGVVDGELVAVVEGQHSHNLVKAKKFRKKLAIFVFDMTMLDGQPLFNETWQQRHEIMSGVLVPQTRIIECPYDYDGKAMMAGAREQGFEGIVSKRTQSRYRPGHRGTDWLNYKFPEYRAVTSQDVGKR